MKKESLYIAGPMCFYENGDALWNVMRDKARLKGYDVTMPSEGELEMDPVDLRKNAVTIFKNCARAMETTTAILCNLEFFRGADPDGGSIFEVGMAYGKGIPCYGYTRDKRPMVWKYQGSLLKDGVVYDKKGRRLLYGALPFSPNITGACKIVEGDFDECLKLFETDLEERRKRSGFAGQEEGKAGESAVRSGCRSFDSQGMPVVYLAGPERYEEDAVRKYERMKEICRAHGLYAIVPTDEVPGLPAADTEDVYANAYLTFLRQQQHVRDCDILLANLNDFHGWEPDGDTAFECGMAYWLGKKSFGYMESTLRMIDRIPNFGEASGYRDACGCNAENFEYPINLMFSGSMPIFEAADFESALDQMLEAMAAQGDHSSDFGGRQTG